MYVVFKCRKCGHEYWIRSDKEISVLLEVLEELSETDCPECGEEGYENWILIGLKDDYETVDSI